MSRIVPAGIQLSEQAAALSKKKVGIKVADEPDGFGRHRAIEFDAATSHWLAPVLDAIADSRIAAMEFKGKRLVVYFVPDSRADSRDEYPLEGVRSVLDGKD